MNLKKILVVDDNHEIRDLLGKYLRQYSFDVTLSSDGQYMRQAMKQTKFDLIVLDIMLPDESGLNLCRFVKETCTTSVILLTAMSEDTDCVVGLELGADDYITKPFTPRVLVARINAVLRCKPKEVTIKQKVIPDNLQCSFSGWCLEEYQRHLVRDDGLIVSLSNAEFTLLKVFLANPKKVLSRDQLLKLTKGLEAMPFDRSVDNQISRLRKKIEKEPSNPRLIKTVRGGGYMFSSTPTFE